MLTMLSHTNDSFEPRRPSLAPFASLSTEPRSFRSISSITSLNPLPSFALPYPLPSPNTRPEMVTTSPSTIPLLPPVTYLPSPNQFVQDDSTSTQHHLSSTNLHSSPTQSNTMHLPIASVHTPITPLLPIPSLTSTLSNQQGHHPARRDPKKPRKIASAKPVTTPPKVSSPPSDDNSGSRSSPDLRFSHKLAERKRRRDMSKLFENLKDAMPSEFNFSRASKGKVLIKAAEHIETLEKLELRLTKEYQRLEQELNLLKQNL